MTLDRQPVALADRRPEERMMIAITAIRAIAPRSIHSQISDELLPLAAGELAGVAAGLGAGAAALVATGGCAVAVGAALLAADRLGRVMLALAVRLLIALPPLPPHPAARKPVTRTATTSTRIRRFRITTG
jgi:hypothetical protein